MAMTNTYDRQEELNLSIPRGITVAGVGGVGSWVAIFAAMSGVESIFLFDPDVVEESNRNRLPFCTGAINRPKVEVVREFILALRPECLVVAVQAKLEGVLLQLQVSHSHTVIDCTDSPKSQILISKACREGRTNFIRAGYDGTHITVTSNVSGWIRDTEEETYTVQPSWVVPSAVVAALAVGKMELFQDQEVSLDLSEIGIPVLKKPSNRLTKRCRR
jgi:molybdopterin/thiamine biosynthesis adenylyltransferase